MSSIIQLLPDHVANQIAAGEVVQRPASVVKELLENAVDAGATNIKLILKDAGKSLIQVIDNGKGMNVTDARLCFERHATSKIRVAEDLFALHTKGFRGEALASIAAIAHVEMKTKQDHDELGTHIIIEGSKFISQDVAVVPKGTSFVVKNLFYNIPARRNFLKSDIVEYRFVIDEFQRIALAHPTLFFTLIHNGSEMFNLPAASLRQRIVGVFSGKTNEKLVPINEETDVVVINGFVCKPEFTKKSRGEQFFFVNDRFIKSGYLHHAVMAAYDGLLKDAARPSYFIYLTVPPNSIDINIHPTKTEIKFDDESILYAILRASIKHSLGQFNVAPVLDFERDATLDTPYSYKNSVSSIPSIEVDRSFNPFLEKDQPNKHYLNAKPIYKRADTAANWESLYQGLNQTSAEIDTMTFETDTMISSLFSSDTLQSTAQKTYQIDKKYIVSAIKSGIMIVDQHRAHQRILYEQFLTSITVQLASSQQLLFPINLCFSRNDMHLLLELKPVLTNIGFVFAESQEESLVILGLPVTFSESDVTTVLDKLLSDLHTGIPGNSFSQNDVIAKSMAQSLAVKAGTYLTEKEQEHLINGLFACKDPSVSPHQKTTFITMNVEDVDKKFTV
jgi:DNA mismatch repair protein MutL